MRTSSKWKFDRFPLLLFLWIWIYPWMRCILWENFTNFASVRKEIEFTVKIYKWMHLRYTFLAREIFREWRMRDESSRWSSDRCIRNPYHPFWQNNSHHVELYAIYDLYILRNDCAKPVFRGLEWNALNCVWFSHVQRHSTYTNS